MGRSQLDAASWNWRTTIKVCGAVAGVLVFGTVLTGVLVEARQLWIEGAATFLSDAGMRLVVGACLGIVSAAPYVMLAKASREVGPPKFFAVAALALLAFQIWFMVDTLFFAHSSTASIALLFMPLYLCVAAGAIWAVAAVARGLRLRRDPK
jgi:hypothetical protein